MDRCNISRADRSWENTVQLASSEFEGKSQRSTIKRLILAAAVYLLWRDRNNRRHRGKHRRLVHALLEIINVIKTKVNFIDWKLPVMNEDNMLSFCKTWFMKVYAKILISLCRVLSVMWWAKCNGVVWTLCVPFVLLDYNLRTFCLLNIITKKIKE